MSDFDLSFYFRVIRKWLWLVIVIAGLVALATYSLLNLRQDVYEARTLMNVGSYLYAPDPDLQALQTGQELTETYTRLVKTNRVIEPTIENLGLDVVPEQIRRSTDTNRLINTALFEIVVRWPDPVEAAAISNELGNQLVLNSPSNITPQLEQQIALSESQIEMLIGQSEELQEQLETLNRRINTAESIGNETVVNTLVTQRSDIIQQFNQATATIAQFSDTITQIEQRSNTIAVQDEAAVPPNPVNQNTLLFTGVATIGSILFVTGGVILIEALDTGLRSENRIEQILDVPVRGSVQIGRTRNFLKMLNNTNIIESYQVLRTNLLYQEGGSVEKQQLFVISSPTSSERRERIVAYLAVAAADSGSKVLLIDADFRNTYFSKALRLPNDIGLVNLLNVSNSQIEDHQQRDALVERVVYQTEMDELSVITTGEVRGNPVRLLESPLMSRWLDVFANTYGYDFIVLNAPPVLLYPDTSALAALTGAEVLLITEYAKTKAENAKAARDQITKVGGHVAGVIFGR